MPQNAAFPIQPSRDALTGLFSRADFEAHYSEQLKRCSEAAATLGLVLLRIDPFSELNNGPCGERLRGAVLQRVAQTLQRVVRASDVLGRYGEEAFSVLALRPTERGLAKVSERIRAAIESEEILFEGNRVPVTVSAGAALVLPGRDASSLGPKLIAAADQAVCEAATCGRNRVRLRSLLTEDEQRLTERVFQCRLSRWLVARSVLDVATLSQALIRYEGGASRLGELAMQHRLMVREQIGQVTRMQRQTQLRFGETAIQLGFLDENRLVRLLAVQQEDPIVLARVLVRMGLLERRHAAELLADYLADIGSDRPAISIAAAS